MLCLHTYYNFSASIAGHGGLYKAGGLIKPTARSASWDIFEDEVKRKQVGNVCLSYYPWSIMEESPVWKPHFTHEARDPQTSALNSGYCSFLQVLEWYFF